jgi:hypothetical protein
MALPPLSVGSSPTHAISTARRSRFLLSGLAAAALVALVLVGRGGERAPASAASSSSSAPAVSAPSAGDPSSSSPPRVPVTIFVMSLCPDAQFCETFLQPILAPLKSVVKLRAEYIVSQAPTATTHEGGGGGAAAADREKKKKNAALTCKHGPRECAGNRQQLCLQARIDERVAAGQATADATVDVLLRFLTCGWRNPDGIGAEAGGRACLSEAGWAGKAEQDAVLACAGGPEGEALLAASHAATTAAGATNSCTINVAGRRRCVRDGGAWRECDGGAAAADFASTICAALPAGAREAAAAAGVCK